MPFLLRPPLRYGTPCQVTYWLNKRVLTSDWLNPREGRLTGGSTVCLPQPPTRASRKKISSSPPWSLPRPARSGLSEELAGRTIFADLNCHLWPQQGTGADRRHWYWSDRSSADHLFFHINGMNHCCSDRLRDRAWPLSPCPATPGRQKPLRHP